MFTVFISSFLTLDFETVTVSTFDFDQQGRTMFLSAVSARWKGDIGKIFRSEAA